MFESLNSTLTFVVNYMLNIFFEMETQPICLGYTERNKNLMVEGLNFHLQSVSDSNLG